MKYICALNVVFGNLQLARFHNCLPRGWDSRCSPSATGQTPASLPDFSWRDGGINWRSGESMPKRYENQFTYWLMVVNCG